ncbi:MAG: protein-disulfide reductase DsbD family protein [Alphaproteobacteria bacterium]
MAIRALLPALWLTLCLGLLPAGVAGADAAPTATDRVVTDHVTARLVSEKTALRPGEVAWLGLSLAMREGWHTYWENPGDSGEATRIAWTLPEGLTAGEIRWPHPRLIPVGPLANYGYEGQVTLLVPMRLAPGHAASALEVEAAATWLVCAEICIPENGNFRLTLPVAGAGATPPDSPDAPLFARARAHLPRQTPSGTPYSAEFEARDETVTLRVSGLELPDRIESAWFFPRGSGGFGVIDYAGAQNFSRDDGALTLALPRNAALAEAPDRLQGVLVTNGAEGTDEAARAAFDIRAHEAGGLAPLAGSPALPGLSLWQALLFALIGGLILNVMPCVFPILFMKAAGFAAHAHDGRRSLALQGTVFTLGVVASFALLAGILLALRAGGAGIGWGFQLQSPLVLTWLAYLLLVLGFSLSGVFQPGERLMGLGQGLAARRDGLSGAFVTGVLAAVVASPCTAPFMGAALGFAVLQPGAIGLTVFVALGLGMALPYLALSLSPGLLRLLPRPGRWMDFAKGLLAFPLYATALWLLWVLSRQVDSTGLALALSGFLLVGFAIWLTGWARRAEDGTGRRPVILKAVAASALAFALALGWMLETGAAPGVASAEKAARGPDWTPWAPGRPAEILATGRPVLVNFTADWCITCLVNEEVAIARAGVVAAFRDKNLAYLKADWTRRDPEIAAALARFGRNGVPLYVLYRAPGAPPEILPQILTENALLSILGTLPDRAPEAG